MTDASIRRERPYRWSRAEYDRAVEAGVFEADARAELLEGNRNPAGQPSPASIARVRAGVRPSSRA